MDEKMTVGGYTILQSMTVGKRDILLGENRDADEGERYMCCYRENVLVYERYIESLVSDDFAEIEKVFGQRIQDAAQEALQELKEAQEKVGKDAEITAVSCKTITVSDNLKDQVVVVGGKSLRPEYRYAHRQLMLCTGGFGSQPNARGRTCYCISLYDGGKTSAYRSDIIGVIEQEKLPEWARQGLEKAREIHRQEIVSPKERGEAR